MNFSYSKQTLLKPQKEKALLTFFLGILVSAAFFVPYIIMGEGYFMFYGDFNVQQIPFYQMCHKAVRDGNIFWNTTTDLGANFIGSYSFYLLGSPFFWLTLPFPNFMVPYLMGPLLILKFGCAAFTGYLFIRRFTRTSDAAMLGGLLYAFSGFSIYNIFFNHFHEAIILFPLLLLSFELLITENKRCFFALMVCVCAISNYFFFFGMVVFTVIYFFVRLLSGAVKVSLSRFGVIVFEAVLGLGLSCILLYPAILAIVDNYRVSNVLDGWGAIMYGKEQIYANVLQCFFFPPDIPARPVFFPDANVKWSSLGGWLPIFSMVGVFTLFSNRKGSWLKRLIGICVFMSMVPILNSAFYAFNSSYYARWFYMPILIMSLATVILCEDRKTNWNFGFNWVAVITLAITVVIGLFPRTIDDETVYGLFSRGSSEADLKMYTSRFWITSAIALVSLAILYVLLRFVKSNQKAFFKGATACVCIITVIYANFFIISGRSHSYTFKEVMIDSLIEGEVNLNDNSEFRVDVYDGVDNTSMYLGYDGINAFHSVVPSSILEFYDFLDIERSVGSRPEVKYEALRPLLSVKYLFNRKSGDSFINGTTGETKMPGWKYIKSESGYYIYENENYIPYGFSYDYYVTKDYFESVSKTKYSNIMLKAVVLNDEQVKKYSYMYDNLANLRADDDNGVTLETSGEALKTDSARLKATSATNFAFDNTGFEATVKREKETLVFFSIPYDKGWTATVNGKPCEIEKVNVGFMAVKVGKGTSNIRFEYTTPGLKLGILVTTLSAIVLLVYIIGFSIYSKKNEAVNEYPEGDELLKQWRVDEIADACADAPERDRDFVKKDKPNILDNIPDKPTGGVGTGFKGGFTVEIDLKNEQKDGK